MIAKPYEHTTPHPEPHLQAGAEAERQMAHYLNRAFKQDPELHALHGLRLVDRGQPEQDGSPGVCQIDHLIVHRWGMFIIESKSVKEEVRVRGDGSGGDEWSRLHRGSEVGMPSPIRQAMRQAEFLRAALQQHRTELLQREPVGLRTITKVVRGTDQRGFMHVPIQLVVAISDSGKIQRLDGWREPSKPFQVFVTKADLVPEKIGQELERHRRGASLLNIKPTDKYGLWSMEAHEAAGVAEFLAVRHVDRSDGSPTQTNRTRRPYARRPSRDEPVCTKSEAAAACKYCGAQDLTANSGPYGYYWRCGKCEKNTPMPKVCAACGTNGRRGGEVKVRKSGPNYFRDCNSCGASERLWTEE